MSRSFLTRQSRLLSRRPLVVGTVAGGSAASVQIALARKLALDLVEIRLDGFPETALPPPRSLPFVLNLLADFRRRTGKPLLATLRAPRERGQAGGPRFPDAHREKLLRAALPLVDAIDVEIRSTALARRLTPFARRRGVNVLHSYHDFTGPGRLGDLTRWAALSKRLHGDVFKAAVTPSTNDELELFLRWGGALSNPRVALIGMGAVGLVSRAVGFSFGSILTYGHLGQSTAPGQMAAADLLSTIHSLYR